MNKQQLMQEVFNKDPRGCSAGDIALALNSTLGSMPLF